MKRVLKNFGRNTFSFSFRGRTITFKAKTSKTFNMELEEEAAEYRLWQERIGRDCGNPMIGDITDLFPQINHPHADIINQLDVMIKKLSV